MDVFTDKSIINHEIVEVQRKDDKTMGISLDIEIPIGMAGTEILLPIDELREALRLLEEEYQYSYIPYDEL